MALPRAVYLEHIYRLVGRYFTTYPDLIQAIGPVFEDYTTTGSYGTLAERREACRTMAQTLWTGPLGQPYDGHIMKHFFQTVTDVPPSPEPPA